MKRLLVLLLVVLPLSACSEDSSGPQEALEGTWRFTYGNMTGTYLGINVSCNVGQAEFQITQTGNTFSGVQVGSGQITCTGAGQTLLDTTVTGETIVDGQISGNIVSFRLGSLQGQNTATLSGTSMTGTAQWLAVSGNTAIT